MKKHCLWLMAVSLCAGLFVCGQPAVYAQDDTDVFTLKEIIVTAERRETSVHDTPVAVSAWDEETIDAEAIDGMQDLQMRMPSTQFVADTQIYIRGIGRENQQLGMDPGVGVYQEGFFLSFGGSLGNLFDVARVETVRGPQSTLFGRNTIGGVIQMWYTRPKSEFDGHATLRVGELGSSQLLAFGGPLAESDTLKYRLVLKNHDWDGNQYNFHHNEHVGGSNWSTVDAFLLYEPTSKLEFWGRYWFSTTQQSNTTRFQPDPYESAVADKYYTYPGDSEETLVQWMDPKRGITWVRNQNKEWGVVDVLPNRFFNCTWTLQKQTNQATDPLGCANPVYNAHNPATDDIYKSSFNDPGFVDFDGMGGQLTTTYEATDALTFKLLTSYRDWLWYGSADGDGSAAPYGYMWTTPVAQYAYSGELQAVYGSPDSRLSYIVGAYYMLQHQIRNLYWMATGAYDDVMLPNGHDAPHDVLWYDAVNPGNKSAWGWTPLQQAGYDNHLGHDTQQMAFMYESWIDTDDTAIYGQMDFQLTDKLNVTAGLRWAMDSKKGFEKQFVIDGARGANNNYIPRYNSLHLDIIEDVHNGDRKWDLYKNDPARADWLNVDPGGAGDWRNPSMDDAWAQLPDPAYPEFSDPSHPAYKPDGHPCRSNPWLCHDPEWLDGQLIRVGDPISPNAIPGWGNYSYWWLFDEPDPGADYAQTGVIATSGPGEVTALAGQTHCGWSDWCDKPTGAWWGFPASDGGTRDREMKADWQEVVGKLGVDYTPSDSTLLFLSYSRGYKPGAFNLGWWQPTNPDNTEPLKIDPEYLDAYEGGWKQLWMDRRWRTTLGGFWYVYSGLQLETYVNQVRTVTNMGSQDVWGIEFDFEGYLIESVRVNGAYSYNHGEYNDAEDGNPVEPWTPQQQIGGNQLKRIPRHKFTLAGTYTHPTDVGDFVMNVRYYWQDEVFYDQYQSQAGYFEPWDRVDARIWWNSPSYKWRVALDLSNAFDSVGVMNVTEISAPARLRDWTVIAPRTWGIEVSYRF